MKFSIDLETETKHQIRDNIMVAFLKDDLATMRDTEGLYRHPDDIKYDKKLMKAYKTILKYYGVNDV